MTGGMFLLGHLWVVWWTFPVWTKGGHSLLSVHWQLNLVEVSLFGGVLSELSPLISAVSLK